MRLFLIAALMLPSLASAEPVKPARTTPQPVRCDKVTPHFAKRGSPATPKKLNELPPAKGYAAVYQLVDGCLVPVPVAGRR